MKFSESMIDHLNIPSRIIEAESERGKSQVSKFGIPESFAGVNMEESINDELSIYKSLVSLINILTHFFGGCVYKIEKTRH